VELQGRAASKGLAILAFPCNQFGGQEPGTAQEVETWAREKYGASWHFMDKVDVNGSGAHPLFAYLKTAQPGFLINAIKWNFTKFLINREGKPVARFGPNDSVVPTVEAEVEKLL